MPFSLFGMDRAAVIVPLFLLLLVCGAAALNG